jgi:phosphatidylethanolamine/phosphatidyl-N-methylethanolamine N-methyltransferase
MNGTTSAPETAPREELLFLRRWLAHPRKVGALLPSSPALARLVARAVHRRPDEFVVELGAGTRAVTKALLAAGIPVERLQVIEIDAALAAFLRRDVPQARVVLGDATRLAELLPPEAVGRVGTVISGIPMVTLPIETQRRMVDSWFSVLAPGGHMLQYTYSLVSPLPEAKLGLRGRRRGVAVLNLPPASVWSYVRADAAARRAA